MPRTEIALEQLAGRTISRVERVGDTTAVVVHFSDGATLYADEPTAYDEQRPPSGNASLELTCTITHDPMSATDVVPWRYRITDGDGTILSSGWAASRHEAEERARADAAAIRSGALDEHPPETFAL